MSRDPDAVQFEPMPRATLGIDELDPVTRRSVRDVLEAAQNALVAGNIAVEDNDQTKALQQYTLMLELLADANLDPQLFYTVRQDFNQIIDKTIVQARAYERDPTLNWREQATYLPSVRGLQYPTPLPERVLKEIEAIVEVYPGNFERGLERSARYLPYIREQFIAAGLPEDLVWLAMVESQFTPKIVSRAGAGGMWQFMRSTGRRYGLVDDYYLDERYEWKKATGAAIQYLKQLYTIFDGDWPLAVSAYNMGEFGLERAIAANGGDRNLWTLIERPPAANRIRLETKKFYPKLLASAIVAKNPERYGMNPDFHPVDDTVYVKVSGAYLLRDLDRASNLPSGTIARLNPQLIRDMTPPNRDVDIMVPRGSAQAVRDALEILPKLRPDTHVVRRGETPSGIAKLYQVSSSELMRMNNIRSARSLQIGQRLVIPGRAGASATGPTGTLSGAGGRAAVHTVIAGDSLTRIASRNGVTVRQLQQWNNLGQSTRIHVGDRLYVVAPSDVTASTAAAADAAAPEVITHTVRRGESPSKIAGQYGVSTNDVLRWNKLNRNSVLQIGQKLRIEVANGGTAAVPNVTTYTVKRGDTPSEIAEQFGVSLTALRRANNWSRNAVIRVGDRVTIPQP